jgi:hypothetical protein
VLVKKELAKLALHKIFNNFQTQCTNMAQKKGQQEMDDCDDSLFYEVHEIVVQKLGHVPIAKGDFNKLPKAVQRFVAKWVS